MPISTIHVESVETFSGSGFYEIKGRDAAGVPWTFSTNRQLRAAMAERAKVTGIAVTVAWRETARWGRDIVDIDPAETRV